MSTADWGQRPQTLIPHQGAGLALETVPAGDLGVAGPLSTSQGGLELDPASAWIPSGSS